MAERRPGEADTGTRALQVEVAVHSQDAGRTYRPTHIQGACGWLPFSDVMQVGDVLGAIHVWWVRLPGRDRFTVLEADVDRDGGLTWWLLVDEDERR